MADITLGSVTLPGDLEWIDEFADGSDLVASTQRVTVTGALIIQASAQQAGRKITLQGRQLSGGQGFAPLTRTQVNAVRALAATAGTTYTLTLSDARSFTVMFRRDDGPAIEAAPLKVIVPAADDDLYYTTIRLIQV